MSDVSITIGAVTKDFIRAINGVDTKLKNTEKLLTDSSKKMGVVLAAITGVGVLATKSFSKFENDMKAVKTLLDDSSFSGKTQENGFKDLTKEALNLAKVAPVSVDNLTKSLFDTVSAGVEAGKAVKFVETSSKLAVAGVTDLATANDGLTSATNAYKLSADDADTTAAKFFLAQKRGKTTIAELSRFFGVAGASAASFGVKFEELLGVVSTATVQGIKTSTAFQGANAVLANIATPTAEATAEAERLGITFDTTALRAQGLEKFLAGVQNSANFNQQSFERLFGSIEARRLVLAITGKNFK